MLLHAREFVKVLPNSIFFTGLDNNGSYTYPLYSPHQITRPYLYIGEFELKDAVNEKAFSSTALYRFKMNNDETRVSRKTF